ncbi:Zinc finger protein YPR022C [Ceratocystis fimbriata CBS 114723]|uniref:Zinc finger protein YPR022C n=1 Tax=Ceratocystis fimbriata CBS 114723 TaxID=1035309 RepID=A0A2C5WVL7_9PEZI|nr:Zinc finger protein YPR022C [Ceratocystis fimbriata CBS 114723]
METSASPRPDESPLPDEAHASASTLASASSPTVKTYKRASRKGAPRRFACLVSGCHKLYSRAEHLSRHQLNHNPKQIFCCDHSGCRQQFVRADLLARHRKRHNSSYVPRNREPAFCITEHHSLVSGSVTKPLQDVGGTEVLQGQQQQENMARFGVLEPFPTARAPSALELPAITLPPVLHPPTTDALPSLRLSSPRPMPPAQLRMPLHTYQPARLFSSGPLPAPNVSGLGPAAQQLSSDSVHVSMVSSQDLGVSRPDHKRGPV